MTEERAKYHIDNEEEAPPAEQDAILWKKIIDAITLSPEWFANQLNENQARKITQAIKAKYPDIK